MKRFFRIMLIFGFISLVMLGCKSKNNPTPTPDPNEFPNDLIGTWKEISVEGTRKVTNEVMILEILNTKNAAMRSKLVFNEIPYWQYMGCDISYSNDTLMMAGVTDVPFVQAFYKYRIINLSSTTLEMQLLSKIINGENQLDPAIGKKTIFEKGASNVTDQIVHTWVEKMKGNVEETVFGIMFKNDGKYDFFLYDASGNATVKSDNDGHYFFYGNFLALRYFNDFELNDSEYHVECWNVKMEESQGGSKKIMYLEKVDDEGKLIKYELELIL